MNEKRKMEFENKSWSGLHNNFISPIQKLLYSQIYEITKILQFG